MADIIMSVFMCEYALYLSSAWIDDSSDFPLLQVPVAEEISNLLIGLAFLVVDYLSVWCRVGSQTRL